MEMQEKGNPAVEALEKQLRVEEKILEIVDRRVMELMVSLNAAKEASRGQEERCHGIRAAIKILRGEKS